MKKVVFWDFDGTLVHCDHLWSSAVLTVLRENGVPASLADVRPQMQTGYPWDLSRPHRELRGDAWWPFLYRKFEAVYRSFGIPSGKAASLGPRTREEILDIRKFYLYGDTVSALEETAALGWDNRILSNNYPELREIIAKLGLTRHFSGFVISGEIGLDKPRPEIFHYALEQAGNPKICCMIGDNPRADVAGAVHCGIPAILVHREDAPASPAVKVCATLTEAVAFLREHEDALRRV